ncbi:dolichyl-phosphate-mannose-protein mannosyltransferase [Coriobacteriaceae bacterium BV3Ac1]|nr:dolichyl-phosphate-mannose-protein mannosyltransferase [Coriobacteriaceae bacterium BV3Ac1]
MNYGSATLSSDKAFHMKKERPVIHEWPSNLIQIVFALAFIWIGIQAFSKTLVEKNTLYTGVVFLFYAVLLFIIKYFIKGNFISAATIKRFIPLSFVAYLLVLIILSHQLALSFDKGTWDFHVLARDAYLYASGNTAHNLLYYARYPNNLALLTILIPLFKLALCFNPSLTGMMCSYIVILFNCFCIFTTLVLLHILVKKTYKSSSIDLFVVVLFELFTPFWLYAPIYYTDTVVMPLVVLLLFGYRLLAETSFPKAILYAVLLGILAAIGFLLKATVIFIFLGLIFCLLRNWKRTYRYIVVTSITFVAATSFISPILQSSFGISSNMVEANKFPYTHWVMMSLNPKGEGGFIQADVDLIESSGSITQKQAKTIQLIRQRIGQRGLLGTLYHCTVTKVQRTWGSGTLASSDYIGRHPEHINMFLHNYFPNYGKCYRLHYSFSQAYWLVILLGTALYGIGSIRTVELDYLYIAKIALLLLFMFLMAWECNARYLVHFAPLLILISAHGLVLFMEGKVPTPHTAIQSEKY